VKVELAKQIPSIEDVRILRAKILRWFNKNGRSYPWRETFDPFRVLIAEMMLRRTKADQVKKVYERIFTEYPDIEAMANSRNKKLQRILQPLGLNWRLPSFRLVARELRKKYQCRVPQNKPQLMSLPGVGDYVAGAVLSIAYNRKEGIVDSNIVRLYRRYFALKTSKEGRRDKYVIEIAKIYASGRKPRKANLAVLDFTALVCTPRKPHCEKCLVCAKCRYIV